MNVEMLDLKTISPYDRNPRKNKKAIETVKQSLEEFGWRQPIVVDKNNIIVVGHTRYEAAKILGLNKIPVLVAADLSEEQCRAYRIMDNRSNENAEWDYDLLIEEFRSLENIDLELTGFNKKEIEELLGEADTIYNKKVDSPLYTAKGIEPSLDSLTNLERFNSLVEDIEQSRIPKDIKQFLIYSAHRHIEFDYESIAEYYCHATPEVQKLMEDSALIIIDFNRAIDLGYVKLNDDLRKCYIDEFEDNKGE